MSFDPAYLIALPLLGAVLSLWGSLRPLVVLISGLSTFVLSLYAFLLTFEAEGALYWWVGGWRAPLGIGMRLDGLSSFFLMMTAMISTLVGLYALGFFRVLYREQGGFFWFFFFFLWAGLNAFFLSEDLFNLYVAFEVLSLTAVLLVALPGNKRALRASLNYLQLSLLASLLYLLGVGMLYAGYGTLSMSLLSERFSRDEGFLYSLFPILLALGIKSALVPFHFWLPPAHSGTFAPASALLSSLVVKPPAYLMLRLWMEVLPRGESLRYLSEVLSLLGLLGVLLGSYYAIRQKTIKMLLAYSTVSQIGYLFLMAPLYYHAPLQGMQTTLLEGFAMQVFSHATAKASMFLSSGNAIFVAQKDELTLMPGFAHSHPLTFFALFFSGATLIGLPLSGGFVAKFTLLKASLQMGFFLQGFALLGGSLLAALYVYPLWRESFSSHPDKIYDQPVQRSMELSAFLLGFVAFSSGLVAGFLLESLSRG